MEHLSITFPENLRRELDSQAKREKTKRSTLIQKAVRIYLHMKQKNETAELLRDGYQAMYGESLQITEDFKQLDQDSEKYAD